MFIPREYLFELLSTQNGTFSFILLIYCYLLSYIPISQFSMMYSHGYIIVSSLLSLSVPSSAYMPEYATRVMTQYRYPIPYPTPTNTYNTDRSSLTSFTVTEDWSTPSDSSLSTSQTDSHRPSQASLDPAEIGSIPEPTASSSRVSSQRDSTISTHAASAPIIPLSSATDLLTGLPRLPSATTPKPIEPSRTSPVTTSSQSAAGLASQRSSPMLIIGALAAAALSVAALI